MSTFLLIRHGECDTGGIISGHSRGFHLTPKGNNQAEAMARRLRNIPIAALYSSPIERTMETAGYIARQKDIAIEIREELIEVNFGDWTGKKMGTLSNDQQWNNFNIFKGAYCVPGGEMIESIASRMCRFIEEVRRKHVGTIAVVSHGDPIKTVIAQYVGIPLDYITRFDILPASISVLQIDDYGAVLNCLNTTGTDLMLALGEY
ncbi:MAG TPA: histidine phosphatase family protein [Chitinispirillaceae bacterium]|nr:histidine phosphatase family protein [Chitinispirillaceae bacterium]